MNGNGGTFQIRIIGDTVLRERAKPVAQVTDEHRRILSEMARLMYAAQGIGLAAPQVGISESLMVVDIGEGLYKLVNARITGKKGRQCIEEGCLSVPGVGVKVKRAKKIKLEALDESGKPVCIEAEDLLACVMQHEHDHLEGKLIVDYANVLERIKIKRKLKSYRAQVGNETVPQRSGESYKL